MISISHQQLGVLWRFCLCLMDVFEIHAYVNDKENLRNSWQFRPAESINFDKPQSWIPQPKLPWAIQCSRIKNIVLSITLLCNLWTVSGTDTLMGSWIVNSHKRVKTMWLRNTCCIAALIPVPLFISAGTCSFGRHNRCRIEFWEVVITCNVGWNRTVLHHFTFFPCQFQDFKALKNWLLQQSQSDKRFFFLSSLKIIDREGFLQQILSYPLLFFKFGPWELIMGNGGRVNVTKRRRKLIKQSRCSLTQKEEKDKPSGHIRDISWW